MRCLLPIVGPVSRLSELLRARGADVVEVQVGEIVPVPTEIPVGTEWVTVVSQNSVPELVRTLNARNCGCLRPKIAAVGGKTATALRSVGLTVDFLPSVATAEALRAELHRREPSARIFDFKGYENRPVPLAGTIDLADFTDVYFTCASSVDRLLQNARGATRCHAIGPSTSAALRRRGIAAVREASEPTLEALADT